MHCASSSRAPRSCRCEPHHKTQLSASAAHACACGTLHALQGRQRKQCAIRGRALLAGTCSICHSLLWSQLSLHRRAVCAGVQPRAVGAVPAGVAVTQPAGRDLDHLRAAVRCMLPCSCNRSAAHASVSRNAFDNCNASSCSGGRIAASCSCRAPALDALGRPALWPTCELLSAACCCSPAPAQQPSTLLAAI